MDTTMTGRRATPAPFGGRVMRLEQIRLAKSLSQRDLQAASGVQQAHISRIEQGKQRNVYLVTVRKIANALGVDPAQIAEFRPRLGLDT